MLEKIIIWVVLILVCLAVAKTFFASIIICSLEGYRKKRWKLVFNNAMSTENWLLSKKQRRQKNNWLF